MRKNNNYGFTLIELLAVIVILGILLIIAVPSILGTLNTSKRDAFIDFAMNVIKKSEEASLDKLATSNQSEFSCFKYAIESDLGLKNTGDYKGWLVFDVDDDTYYMTLYSKDYMIVNFVYDNESDDSIDKTIKEKIETLNESQIELLKKKVKNDEDGTEDYARVFTIDSKGGETKVTLEEKCKIDPDLEEGEENEEGIEEINETRIYLLSGKEFNTALKQTDKEYYSYTSKSPEITEISFTCETAPPNAKVVSTNQTKKKAYAWREGGKVKITYDDCSSNMDVYLPRDMSYMFYEFSSLTKIDGFDSAHLKNHPQGITDMSYFLSDTLIHSINGNTLLDFSWINTSKVTSMVGTFQSNPNITGLNLKDWDTSNVKNFTNMFYGCKNLSTLDTSAFSGASATQLNRMFFGCENLNVIDLRSFAPKQITNLTGMFEGCKALTRIKGIDYFDVSHVTSFVAMFRQCSSLQYLVLTNWHFKGDEKLNMDSMFENCSSLRYLVSNHSWQDDLQNRDANSSSMFAGCKKMVIWESNNKCVEHGAFGICKRHEYVFERYDLDSFHWDNILNLNDMIANVNHLNTTEGTKCRDLKCGITDMDHFKSERSDWVNYTD